MAGFPTKNKFKKWFILALTGLLPAGIFIILFFQNKGDPITSTGGLIITVLLMVALGSHFSKHPFTQVEEGDGLLVADVSSIGSIRLFTVYLEDKFLVGKYDGKNIKEVFSRDLIHYLKYPVRAIGRMLKKTDEETKEEYEELILKIPKHEKDTASFSFESSTILLYNSILGTFVTKDAWRKLEEKVLIHHLVLNQTELLKETGKYIEGTARYYNEQFKKEVGEFNVLGMGLKTIVVLVFVVLILIMMAPTIISQLTQAGIIPQATGTPPPASTLPITEIPKNPLIPSG
jgi:hypothetical protein|tara:strand:+ start:10618 stop:11484 length:867 start_codon:yes stop_codon:yes gene_type:complete